MVPLRYRKKIKIARGQCLTSCRSVAEGVSWRERGVRRFPNSKSIWASLKSLESNGLISYESNRYFTLITICDYSFYNDVDNYKSNSGQLDQSNARSNAQVTVRDQRLDTNKELKALKEVKELKHSVAKPKETKKEKAELSAAKIKVFERYWYMSFRKKEKSAARNEWAKIFKSKLDNRIVAKIFEGILNNACYVWEAHRPKYWKSAHRFLSDRTYKEPIDISNELWDKGYKYPDEIWKVKNFCWITCQKKKPDCYPMGDCREMFMENKASELLIPYQKERELKKLDKELQVAQSEAEKKRKANDATALQ